MFGSQLGVVLYIKCLICGVDVVVIGLLWMIGGQKLIDGVEWFVDNLWVQQCCQYMLVWQVFLDGNEGIYVGDDCIVWQVYMQGCQCGVMVDIF